MKRLALLLGLAGCDVVFPLRDGRDASLPTDGIDLTKPLIAVQMPRPVAGEPVSYLVALTGTPSSLINYDVVFSQGEPNLLQTELAVDVTGTAFSTHQWTPEKFGPAAAMSRADYDADLSDVDLKVQDLQVALRVGQRQASQVPTLLPALTAVALRVDTTASARGLLGGLTVQVLSSPEGVGVLGLYDGDTEPVNLLASSVIFPLPQDLQVIEQTPMPVELPPDSYWIVFVAKTTTQLGSSGAGGVLTRTADLPNLSLPAQFPTLDAAPFTSAALSLLLIP